MQKEQSLFKKEIEETSKRFEKTITEKLPRTKIIDIGVRWYNAVNEINVAYDKVGNASSLDHESVYYIACRILDIISYEILFPNQTGNEVQALEGCKELLAREISEHIMEQKSIQILVFEPHHDDYMGSASSILYADNKKIRTIVYTMAKSGDDRDQVDLSKIYQYPDVPSRKKTTVSRHIKCELEDLHYDLRYESVKKEQYSSDTTYASFIHYYIHCGYPVGKLAECIRKAFVDFQLLDAKDKYILLPLGMQHPMHILTAYYAAQAACKMGISHKVIFYIDHPYDFQLRETNRLEMAISYYSNLLGSKYIRADGTGVLQKEIADILSAVYTPKHYGEFAGTLGKTMCSYFVPEKCLHTLKQIIPLHVNNVLYATFQAMPFFKTGGAGEVAFSFVRAMSSYVNHIGIILPDYKRLKKAFAEKYSVATFINGKYYGVYFTENGNIVLSQESLADKNFDVELLNYSPQDTDFKISLGSTVRRCRIEKYLWKGVVYYLLNIEGCFEHENVFDHPDIEQDCAAFSLAVMKALDSSLDFKPTILHCNDYQTALIPFLQKIKYPNYADTIKTIYTIHFYGYKGIYSRNKILKYLNISYDTCDYCLICRKNEDCLLNSLNAYSPEDIAKLGIPDDKISLMKTGIMAADIVNTVSKGYASTIQNYPDFRGRKVYGIRNGISMRYEEFSSSVDSSDYWMQTNNNWEEVKKHNKKVFQKEVGLNQNSRIPMFCMVSRMNAVKGIEDIKNIFSKLMELDLQLVIVGDDDKNTEGFSPYADFFRQKMKEFPGKFFYSGYNEKVEFKVYSASDVLLMPSRVEACGTTHILAMKYGVLPVVSMLGSFQDTVIDYNCVIECKDKESKNYVEKRPDQMDKGVGFFCFADDCWSLLDIITMLCKKLKSGEKEKKWRKAVNSTVSVDFSWHNNCIREYLELYDGLSAFL